MIRIYFNRKNSRRNSFLLWLLIASGFALIPYFIFYFSHYNDTSRYIVNDARHFVVWLRSLNDPNLFQNDIIAKYFVNSIPWLYKVIFYIPAYLNIDAVVFQQSIMMPMSILLFVWSAFSFIYYFIPYPPMSFLYSMFLMYLVGMRFDGLPHSFGFALLVISILSFLISNWVLCFLSLLCAVSLLPACGIVSIICITIMQLDDSKSLNPFKLASSKPYMASIIGFFVGSIIIIYSSSNSGPSLSAIETKSIPMFQYNGIHALWGKDLLSTYLCNDRLGLMPFCGVATDGGKVIWIVIVILSLAFHFFSIHADLFNKCFIQINIPGINKKLLRVWNALFVSGLALFFVSHILAFKLAQPERFIRYSITFVFVSGLSLFFSASVLIIARSLNNLFGALHFAKLFVLIIFVVLFNASSYLIFNLNTGITKSEAEN